MTTESITPSDFQDAAAALAEATERRRSVRIVGGATKQGWGMPGTAAEVELRSAGLDRTLEHNPGDLTAIFEAGVPLTRLQAELAQHGQMLAIDPPPLEGATIGGVFATADSGPLRHRYGQPRDLVLGITVALSDGTIAKAGSKVIKNVAGYDLAKLFTGSFGTLGMILSLSVRLHPRPTDTVTAVGSAVDPVMLGSAALALARAPLELEALDVAWSAGGGSVLAQAAGAQARHRGAEIARQLEAAGLVSVEVVDDDAALWSRQRAGQRSSTRAIARVGCRPSELPQLFALTERLGGALVGRVAAGSCYIELDPAGIAGLREALGDGAVAVVLDLPTALRGTIDVWGPADDAALALMRRVKQRFDPSTICNPGVFVGGI